MATVALKESMMPLDSKSYNHFSETISEGFLFVLLIVQSVIAVVLFLFAITRSWGETIHILYVFVPTTMLGFSVLVFCAFGCFTAVTLSFMGIYCAARKVIRGYEKIALAFAILACAPVVSAVAVLVLYQSAPYIMIGPGD